MKHLKKYNESNDSFQDELAKEFNKINHRLDPRILAANIKNNIDDFSEATILALFYKYGEQVANETLSK